MAHSRETEHYQLPLYDGTDIINPLTDFNNANEMIDETMYNVAQRAASAEQSAQQSAGVVHDYDERVTEAENTAQNAGIKADNTMNMIAEEFNPLKEGGYAIGDMVIYNQHLYSFINPHTGAWDASDVKEQPIGDALEDTIAQAKVEIQRALTEAIATIAAQMVRVDNTQKMIGEPFDADKDGGYEKGDIVTYADRLWMFSEDHSGVWTGADVEQVDVIELLENINTDLYTITDAINENLAETKSKVDANNGDTEVTIVGPGVSFPSDGYTFNSDGYLMIHVSSAAPAKITATVVGSNGNTVFTSVTPSESIGITYPTFVKKGMKLSSASYDGNSWTGGNYIHFVPLI